MSHCALIVENIYTPPTEGNGISWEWVGSVRPKILKKCMKLTWNLQNFLVFFSGKAGGGGGVGGS